MFPQYAITYLQYGSYLTRNGRVQEGIEQLRKALEIEPNLVIGHVWLAKAYDKAGKADMARSEAETALAKGVRRVPAAVPAELRDAALALECAGHEQAVLDCCKAVRKGGEVVLFGILLGYCIRCNNLHY